MGGWRFMASVVPILTLLAVTGATEAERGLSRALKSGGQTVGRAVGVALCLFVLASSLFGHSDYWSKPFDGYMSWAAKRFTLDQRALLQGWMLEMTLPISDWLNANLAPGSVVAYTEMGVTPFYSPQIRFLDPNGLTDHGVATLPGVVHIGHGVIDNYTSMNDKVGPYLVNVRKPDYILRGAQVSGTQSPSQEPILDGHYVYLAAVPLPPRAPDTRSFMMVWKRRADG